MMISPTAGPAAPAKLLYACSTFGDLLGCLARLRVTVEPLSGLEHLGGRPVVPSGISAQDVTRLSGPASYEFPVLVEIPADSRCEDGWLAQSVPVSQTGVLVFRSEAERERIVNAMLDDVPVDGLSTRVQPELFERFEPALPVDAPRRSPAARTWIADAVGGAMCGLLLAVSRRAACAQVLEEGFPGPWRHWPGAVDILREIAGGTPPTLERRSLALAAFSVALRLSGRSGLDADGVLDLFSRIVAEWHIADAEAVAPWSRYVREITSWQRALSAAEVRDPIDEKGNVVLRALLLSLFRERIDHVLEDRVDGELPGARVTVVAGMLVGMRTGLHRCSRELKQPFAATLGALAAAVDLPGDAAVPFETFMPTARYGGRGPSRVLRVADGANSTLAEHPAPEEALLDRLVRILTAGGLPVSTANGQCTVSRGSETVYLTSTPSVQAVPVKRSRRGRAKTVKAEEPRGLVKTETSSAGTDAVAGGAAKDAAKVPSVARKPRSSRKKSPATPATSAAGATAAGAGPESNETAQTSDLFDAQSPVTDKQRPIAE
jgi:hypothetical protein